MIGFIFLTLLFTMRFSFSIIILISSFGYQLKDSQKPVLNLTSPKAAVRPLKAPALANKKAERISDTVTPYSNIIFQKKEMLVSAPGTKSVLFNSSGSKLYAMNLEGMSIYEFDQPTRKILRVFKFRATKGTGWDYEGDTAIESYQEKPVEACFSNDDKILWVSLHNAKGIVPIMVDSFHDYPKTTDTTNKHVTVFYRGSSQKDSFDVPLI